MADLSVSDDESDSTADLPLTLDLLPEDALTRILEAISGTHHDRRRELFAAACTCRRLHASAARAAREHVLSLLPPDCPWVGQPPPVWSRCYGEACELWRARWRSAPDDLNLNEGHSIACPPQPVFAHSASLWRQKLFVFGGRHTETYSDSLSMLDLSAPSPRWGEVATLGAPPSKRRAHTATVCDGRLYILGGGVAHAETCGDMHSVSLTPPHTWRAEPSPARWRRFGHTSVLVASPPASPPTRRRAPPLWSRSSLATGLALEALEAGVREALEVQEMLQAARGVAGGDLIVFGGASYRPGEMQPR